MTWVFLTKNMTPGGSFTFRCYLKEPTIYKLTTADKTKIPNYPNLEELIIGKTNVPSRMITEEQLSLMNHKNKVQITGICSFEFDTFNAYTGKYEEVNQDDKSVKTTVKFATIEELRVID